MAPLLQDAVSPPPRGTSAMRSPVWRTKVEDIGGNIWGVPKIRGTRMENQMEKQMDNEMKLNFTGDYRD